MATTSSNTTVLATTTWKMMVNLLSEEDYRTYDAVLAVILSLCTIVGLPGNLLSLFYFYSASRRDFSSLIYTIVSTIDICTCVFHIPVTIALFNNRRPGIFGNMTFCVSWIVIFNFVQLISMFLVMLLSVSRAITLILLRYKIRKKFLIAACLAYTSFLLMWHVIAHIFGGPDKWYGFYEFDVYCYRYLSTKPVSYIEQLIRAICIGFPPIVTTVSFTIVSYKLLQNSQVSNKNKRKHEAAVTMAMFTALFLVCNLPCLLNNIMWFVTLLFYTYPEPIYSHPFMAYYSWLISDVVCTVLNAALNPILYVCRMGQFRQWVSTGCSRQTRNTVSSQRSTQLQTTRA